MFLYKKIEDYLIQYISPQSGEKEIKLPSENQLALKFGASRISVRKALAEMEQKKLIYRIKGKGTYALIKQNNVFNEFNFAFIAPMLQSYFIDKIIKGLTDFCMEYNANFIILSTRQSPLLEKQQINYAIKLGFKNLLIMPTDDSANYEFFDSIKNTVQILFLDRKYSDKNIPYISSDHFDIGFQAAKYLIERNFTNIAFPIAERLPSSMKERMSGYEQAEQQLLGKATPRYVYPFEYRNSVYDNFCIYFKKNPSVNGIILNGSSNLVSILKAISDCGKTLWEDFGVIVIDDEKSEYNEIFNTRIPTIIQDGVKLGYTAAMHLFRKEYFTANNNDITIPIKIQII